jgi:hypothetical protein
MVRLYLGGVNISLPAVALDVMNYYYQTYRAWQYLYTVIRICLNSEYPRSRRDRGQGHGFRQLVGYSAVDKRN